MAYKGKSYETILRLQALDPADVWRRDAREE